MRGAVPPPHIHLHGIALTQGPAPGFALFRVQHQSGLELCSRTATQNLQIVAVHSEISYSPLIELRQDSGCQVQSSFIRLGRISLIGRLPLKNGNPIAVHLGFKYTLLALDCQTEKLSPFVNNEILTP
jgi:hypothetical protein